MAAPSTSIAGPRLRPKTAAAHLARDCVVLGETYPPGWVPAAGGGQVTRLGDAEIVLLSASVTGDRLEAVVRYGVDGRSWTQRFAARVLDEPGLGTLLDSAGLA